MQTVARPQLKRPQHLDTLSRNCEKEIINQLRCLSGICGAETTLLAQFAAKEELTENDRACLRAMIQRHGGGIR